MSTNLGRAIVASAGGAILCCLGTREESFPAAALDINFHSRNNAEKKAKMV